MHTHAIDLEAIAQKEQRLEEVKGQLKDTFSGIDAIIDDLISYIRIWYLMPEVLVRPVIINMWGMTGVGKTDLIRKMVSLLGFQDRFGEIELNHSNNRHGQNSIAETLAMYGLQDGEPAIVLFDEIQRFNTLDHSGNLIKDTRFHDFWELLSDGKLSRRQDIDEIRSYLNRYLYDLRERERAARTNPEQEPKDPLVGIWDADEIRKYFGLKTDVVELAGMSEKDVLGIMQQQVAKKQVYEPVSHAKTLIIISGNLDDAYEMATMTTEADVDADIFHAYTTRISMVDIKQALSRLFKPEQVARFGNIHLIYRSLRKQDFEQLITRELERIRGRYRAQFGLELTFSPAIHALIYRNGVFPVQGVRPVLSTITDVLDAQLAKSVFQALTRKCNTLFLDYDPDISVLQTWMDGQLALEEPFQGRVDAVRRMQSEDSTANTAVHEAGHALAYLVCFGLVPLQLKARIASGTAAGFTFPHSITLTRRHMLDKVCVYLAGGLAEEEIFGPDYATIGRESDREEATYLLVRYVRDYGFEESFQAHYALSSEEHQLDHAVTDPVIEALMRQCVARTRELLAAHRALLIQLSSALFEKGVLTPAEVQTIAHAHGMAADVQEESYIHVPAYKTMLYHAGRSLEEKAGE